MGSSLPDPSLRELSFLSLLAGASSLIPFPILDDWAFRFVHRQTVRRCLPAQAALSQSQIRTLSGEDPGSFGRGCFYVAFWSPILVTRYILKRIFKKIFFLLALKEATERASQIFHEGYLLKYTSERRSEGRQLWDNATPEEVQQLRWAIVETIRDVDTSPIRKTMRVVFRSSQSVLLEAAKHLARLARREKRIKVPQKEEDEILEQERRLLDRTLDGLSGMLTAHRDYLDHLTEKFRYYAARRGITLQDQEKPPDVSRRQ